MTDNDDARLADRVRQTVYRHFSSSGRLPSRDVLLSELQCAPGVYDAALQRLAASQALTLDLHGDIAMAIPFSALPTDVVVSDGTTEWWANCGFDGIGVAAMLDRDVTIRTFCPSDGSTLTVGCGPSGLHSDRFVVHLAVPMAQFWHDIGAT
jgi:hypothetical protein